MIHRHFAPGRPTKHTAGTAATANRMTQNSSGGKESRPIRMTTKLPPQISTTRRARARSRGLTRPRFALSYCEAPAKSSVLVVLLVFLIEVGRLLALRAAATYGTVTAAAGALHCTPSAISQHLGKLERETGTALD